MNEPINDGGNAFPQPVTSREGQLDWADEYGRQGMSLRAWLAGQALASIVRAAAFNQNAEDMLKAAGINVKKNTEAFFAMMACDFADALIAELSKPTTK